MQEVKVGKHKLMLYSNIEELPSWRGSKFNMFVLIDSNIGSTIEDVDRRFANLYLMAKNGETEKMKNEINNLRQAIYFVLTEIDTSSMAFISLIHSIDGEVYDDLSEEGIRRMQDKIKGAKVKVVKNTVEEVKKK